ncbi:MAG: bestrophin family ion channel [Mastigocoleus sp. MO_167.B18]|nr:bestrophin family ion channel [Mastigocoleus sp. MO_167.B18]
MIISIIHHFAQTSIFSDSDVFRNIVASLNIVLSLLLTFSANTAHDRFWEGRKLWGGLVNTSRNLARGISIYIEGDNPEDKASKEATIKLVAVFSVATKLYLRGEAINKKLAQLIFFVQDKNLKVSNHPPLEITLWISNYLQEQLRRERINVFQASSLHDFINKIVDILGGCERILKTPVPLFYTLTLRYLLTVYFLLLPWQLVQGLSWWTVPVLGAISFILLGINEIGSEIEEPFGRDPNDLPLDFICDTIRRNVEDIIRNSADNFANRNHCSLQDSDRVA